MKTSYLEQNFDQWLEYNGYKQYFEREIPILKPSYLWKSRKSSWKIDFLSEQLKIAIEIQGGTFSNGGHSRGSYQHSDFNKSNYLQNLGYEIYLLDTKHIKNQDFEMVEFAIQKKISRLNPVSLDGFFKSKMNFQ